MTQHSERFFFSVFKIGSFLDLDGLKNIALGILDGGIREWGETPCAGIVKTG